MQRPQAPAGHRMQHFARRGADGAGRSLQLRLRGCVVPRAGIARLRALHHAYRVQPLAGAYRVAHQVHARRGFAIAVTSGPRSAAGNASLPHQAAISEMAGCVPAARRRRRCRADAAPQAVRSADQRIALRHPARLRARRRTHAAFRAGDAQHAAMSRVQANAGVLRRCQQRRLQVSPRCTVDRALAVRAASEIREGQLEGPDFAAIDAIAQLRSRGELPRRSAPTCLPAAPSRAGCA